MAFLLSFILSYTLVHAQTVDDRPAFTIKTMKISDKATIKVEVADTPKKRAYGLMFIKEWKSAEGMVFVFPDEARRSFWMKNTYLSLSIGFFDRKGLLKEIANLKPQKSVLQKKIDSIYSKYPAKYVLEVPKGWFEANSVAVGDKLNIL